MATPKIILYKSKTYTDGTHPIMLQVIKNGKAIRTVIARCKESEWLTSKSRVSSKNLMAPKINNDIEIALRNFGNVRGKTFLEFFDDHIKMLKQLDQAALHEQYLTLRNQLHNFKQDVNFDDIDEHFILSFINHLRINKRSKNTIRIKMQVLGKILKMARRAKLTNVNPLADMTFSKDKKLKNKLDLHEINLLKDAELNGMKDLARDIFITSFYLRGTRAGDILCLTESNILNDRLIFIEMKTGKQNNYKILSELQRIMDKWRGKSRHGYIFDVMDLPQEFRKNKFALKKAVNGANARIRYHLILLAKELGINKDMSMHIARHSFSRIANNTIKDLTVTKNLIGHSSLAVHEGYISEVSDDFEMDDYAQKVYDKLKPD